MKRLLARCFALIYIVCLGGIFAAMAIPLLGFVLQDVFEQKWQMALVWGVPSAIVLALVARAVWVAVLLLQGRTTPRLARRDFWDFLPNLIIFLKTGFWRS